MDDDAELQRLRSLAYGRADGADARRAAAEAQRQLKRLEQHDRFAQFDRLEQHDRLAQFDRLEQRDRLAPHDRLEQHDRPAQVGHASPGASTPGGAHSSSVSGLTASAAVERGTDAEPPGEHSLHARDDAQFDGEPVGGDDDADAATSASRVNRRRFWMTAAGIAAGLACFGGGHALADAKGGTAGVPEAATPIPPGDRVFLGSDPAGAGDVTAAETFLERPATAVDAQLDAELAELAELMDLAAGSASGSSALSMTTSRSPPPSPTTTACAFWSRPSRSGPPRRAASRRIVSPTMG